MRARFFSQIFEHILANRQVQHLHFGYQQPASVCSLRHLTYEQTIVDPLLLNSARHYSQKGTATPRFEAVLQIPRHPLLSSERSHKASSLAIEAHQCKSPSKTSTKARSWPSFCTNPRSTGIFNEGLAVIRAFGRGFVLFL